MKDKEFIQSILDKIGEFGDGELEFETRDIERLCNIAEKAVKNNAVLPLVMDNMKLDFKTLEKKILKHKAKSEYQQASIVILRDIFDEAKNEQCDIQPVNNRYFAEKFGQTIFDQFLKRWQNHGNDSEGVIVHGENMYEFIRVAKEVHGC